MQRKVHNYIKVNRLDCFDCTVYVTKTKRFLSERRRRKRQSFLKACKAALFGATVILWYRHIYLSEKSGETWTDEFGKAAVGTLVAVKSSMSPKLKYTYMYNAVKSYT